MPKLVVSVDEVAIQAIRVAEERTTIGRRPPGNEHRCSTNPLVSGEHAVLLWSDALAQY